MDRIIWNPIAVIVVCFLILSSSHLVQSEKVLDTSLKGKVSNTVPTTTAELAAEFESWVAYMGAKHPALSSPIDNPPVFIDPLSKLGPRIIVVAKNGRGNFKTVQEAVDAVPINNKERVIIEVRAGVYKERVSIPKTKPFITLKGAGRDVTTIVHGETAGKAGSTYKSATFGVSAQHFIARNISFKNSAPAPKGGAKLRQAVALRITGDFGAFYGCGFHGAQDTLYDDQGRHYFKECVIEGSIDFVFGNGLSIYKHCELKAIATPYGSLTAQHRITARQDSGFSFVNCTVTGTGQIYLGRAWGSYSRVVFAYTWMDDIVVPQGWFNWGLPARQRTVYYGQYQCSGPGASRKGRVRWSHELTEVQAAPFLSLRFIDGQLWVPEV